MAQGRVQTFQCPCCFNQVRETDRARHLGGRRVLIGGLGSRLTASCLQKQYDREQTLKGEVKVHDPKAPGRLSRDQAARKWHAFRKAVAP